MRQENLFAAQKIVVGSHWFTLVEQTLYSGEVDFDGRPLLTGALPLPPLPQSPFDISFEREDWEAEVDAAQRLLRGPIDVLRAVEHLQCKLRRNGYELGPRALLRLADPSYHKEGIHLLGGLLSSVPEHMEQAVVDTIDTITARDYVPLSPRQLSFLESLLLAEINEAADHIVGAKSYYRGGPVPNKRTKSYAQLREVFGNHNSPSSTYLVMNRAGRLFPHKYPRAPLPTFASVDWVEQAVVQAMVESKVALNVHALVEALVTSQDAWGTLLEQVPTQPVREGIAFRLLHFEEFMNEETSPGEQMLEEVTDGLDCWLTTANLHKRSTWTPLKTLHPSDWRREFPTRQPLDVQIPFGWIDHTSVSEGCAKFKRGHATLFVQSPGIDGGINVPGGPASSTRFLLVPYGGASKKRMYSTDNWLQVVSLLETETCLG